MSRKASPEDPVNHRGPWLESEKEFIRKNYHTMRGKAIARTLGRTSKAIHQFACKYGLNKKIPWSDDERRLIRLYYAELGAKGMVDMLVGRKANNIRQEAARLGVRKTI